MRSSGLQRSLVPRLSLFRSRPGLLGAVCLGLFACSGSVVGPGSTPIVSYALQGGSTSMTPSPPVLQLTGSTVSISSSLTTPTPCYSLTASQTLSGTTLSIHVVATANHVDCAQALAAFSFTVKALDVPTTVTQLHVDQTGGVAGFPKIIADQPISLPR